MGKKMSAMKLVHRIIFTVCPLLLPAFATCVACGDDLPPGQRDLDEATKIHFEGKSDYVDRVIVLCESALKKGLDGPGTIFTKELASSTLFRRASVSAQRILQPGIRQSARLRYRELAVKDLESAIKFKPEFADGHLLLCELSSMPGGDRKRGFKAASAAVESFNKANDKLRAASAYLWRARFGDDLVQQLADFAKASELDPDNMGILRQQADFLHGKQQFGEAVKTLKKLVKASPDDAKLRLALAESLSQTGEEGVIEAFDQIEKVIELAPDMTAVYRMRAQLYIAQEKPEEAIEDLTKAIQIDRGDIGARLFRAEIYLFEDELEKARQDVNRALSLNPGIVYGIQLRSRISAAEKKYSQAIDDIRLLIGNDPDDAGHRLQLAAYLNADQRPRAAIKEITRVLEKDASNWRALRSRADAFLSVGKHVEALADYERALKMSPENSGILNNFAWVLATSTDDKVRNGKRAIELATKACEVTEYKEAHILSTLASGYAEAGDFESAIKWSTKAVDLGEGEMKEQLRGELKSYQEKKPWREKQVVEEKETKDRPNLIET
ncbi:MAG TPA: tetratricopeptide repeat protein [Planctomycetes bacterium]|nr:tetratricopeptide repeat protein [Planctomycetaceae bacterium]HIM31962.1 tetratricopeptide repeat protein [Planctomycetota bacterium]